ncbi:hypothetical protein BGX27_003165 [Mortierella sp. AM989]|nr:hypothetical protein BGX27_003165 [Mortierella sp. AM989]
MSIQVYVHSAGHLEDVERFGKNDPYARVMLDLEDKATFVKTSTKKNAGTNPEFNQSLLISSYNADRNEKLYIELLDEETTADEPIAFAAIPLNQVKSSPNQILKGKFDLYTADGKQRGTITLTIAILAFGQEQHSHDAGGQEIKGYSEIDTEQQKRIKSLQNKERAGDLAVAAAIGGGLFAAKSALGGKEEKKEA